MLFRSIYLAVMSYIGWPLYATEGRYLEYFGLIALTLLVIGGLVVLLRRREKMRKENRKQRQASQRRVLRDDNIH